MTDQHTNHNDNTDDEQLPNPLVEFVAMLATALGLAALGFGTGVHLSLMNVQGAVVTTAQLPLEAQISTDLYTVLLALQSWANTALYAAAVLLVSGGVLRERRQLRRRVDRLANRLDDADADDGGDADA